MRQYKRKFRESIKNLILFGYEKIYKPYKICRLRQKKSIRVVFVLSSFSCWKSELLYRAMLNHSRFEPILLTIPSNQEDNRLAFHKYCEEKGYPLIEIGPGKTICEELHPDIILYSKPYDSDIELRKFIMHNLRSLFCYINYGFHGVDEKWSRNTRLLLSCWQIYYENINAWRGSARIMDNHCRNGFITGLPVMDEFLNAKEKCEDPWKEHKNPKKRIIWAPHHSITDNEWLHYSSFERYYSFMLELAEKYQDKVQWAFKPHPLLRAKLEGKWGKQKTDEYYGRWETLSNAQYVDGKYLGLFMHSDAMIHDCGSFTVEYHYTGNPVMYLMSDNDLTHGFNQFQQQAFDLHYKGWCKEEIENFVNDVIEGIDPMKQKRTDFISKFLTPPDGKTASENIIDCILDKSTERKFQGFIIHLNAGEF